VTGGMLFDHIVNRGSYSEADAANIVKQILEAVAYMHANGIAHRDLKPENLLCTGKDNKIIKVTDFGLSKSFGDSKLVTACGTPGTSLFISLSLSLSLSLNHPILVQTHPTFHCRFVITFSKNYFFMIRSSHFLFGRFLFSPMMTFEFLFRIRCS
jgi:serine/threonine protein kinase